MEAKPDNWQDIQDAAKSLGVSEEAIRKWRERGGVPGKWHLAIIEASRGKITPAVIRANSGAVA